MNTTRQLYCDERAPRVRFLPRMSHTTDPLGESEAHEQLLGMFASDLLTSVPRRAVEIARRLLKADAAGLHLCRSDARTAIQQRDLICGDLATLEIADTGMGRSLCKMCLAAGTTVVLSQQEVELTLLRDIRPRLVHVMMVPLYDSAKSPMGILWLAQITSRATYSRADTLILARFAHVLVLGLKLLADAHEREALAAKIDLERKAHAETLQLLRAERAQNQISEASAAGTGRALADEDVAAREAHHRVKNTLQIVASLLAMQARSSREIDTRTALLEAGTRLQLLAHAHECLSNPAANPDGVSVFRLLRVIADTLPRAFAETSPGIRVRLTGHEISMSTDGATALGLIANELVTNACKHAFLDSAPGEITIDLTCDDTSSAILRIADTGAGWAAGARADSFGLSLVHKLAEQLGATLTIRKPDSDSGTMVMLTVPRTLDVDSLRLGEHPQGSETCRSHSVEVTDLDSER